jgi:hypothetical protein
VTSREQLEEAIRTIDAFMNAAPGAPRDAWTMCRGELRLRRRQSEQTLPAVGEAAQHFAKARAELDAGVESLARIPSPPPDREG